MSVSADTRASSVRIKTTDTRLSLSLATRHLLDIGYFGSTLALAGASTSIQVMQGVGDSSCCFVSMKIRLGELVQEDPKYENPPVYSHSMPIRHGELSPEWQADRYLSLSHFLVVSAPGFEPRVLGYNSLESARAKVAKVIKEVKVSVHKDSKRWPTTAARKDSIVEIFDSSCDRFLKQVEALSVR